MRSRQAFFPVLKIVIPKRPERRTTLTKHGECFFEAFTSLFGHLVIKVPPRDKGILGLPAKIHNPAAEGGNSGREQRERQVGGKQPWGGQCLDVVEVSSLSSDEWHNGLWVAGEQRVVSKSIAGTVGDGEGEGLQPGGTAFRVRGEDDVVAAGFVVFLDSHEFLQHV